MLYNLPSGLTINIPLRMYLEMDDEEFEKEIEDLMVHGFGDDIEDPFHLSSTGETIIAIESIEELELPDLSTEEKLKELDVDPGIMD